MRGWLMIVIASILVAGLACASSAPESPPASLSADEFEPFDTPPSIEKQIEPVYPEYAKQNQIEGTVMVRVVLSAKGKVEDARVVESSDRMFEEPALTAVRQFRFKPARKDDEGVRSAVMVPVYFRL